MTALLRRCTIRSLCTATYSFLPCHSGLRAGILGGLMRGIALHYCLAGVHPPQRLPGPVSEHGVTAHCAAVPSRSLCTAAPFFLLSFACAPIGRRFGNLCKHGCAHLAPTVPPPSGNPGWLCARYCAALLPRRCPTSPTPPRVPHQVRDDGALRRCAIALPLHCRSHSHSVIPASERESSKRGLMRSW